MGEQFKQLRLRLDPATLVLANDIQAVLSEAGKPSSLEAVVTLAIETLHEELVDS